MTQVPDTARLEVKFVASEIELDRFTHWIKSHPFGFFIPYPSRWINNVYFDTHDCYAYSENLLGSSVRAKLRYRWYGRYDYPREGTLEVKCKRNYFGWKLRYQASKLSYAEGSTWSQIKQSIMEAAGPEAKILLEAHPQPVILNRYYRHYFVSNDDSVRVTIDTSQSVYDQRYKPAPNILRKSNLPKTLVIEIKCDRRYRDRANLVIQGLPIRVSRNSKYMVGVKSISGF